MSTFYKIIFKYASLYALSLLIFDVVVLFLNPGQDYFQTANKWGMFEHLLIGSITIVLTMNELTKLRESSYGLTIKTGTLIGIFGGFLFGIYATIKRIYFVEIDFETYDDNIRQIVEDMRGDLDLEEEEFINLKQMSIYLGRLFITPAMIFVINILNNTIGCFFLSLFAGIFYIKKNNP